MSSSSMDELNHQKLQNLTERAWVLLDHQINNTCNLCSHRTAFQDGDHSLIAIRDSLKEVQYLLLHLQIRMQQSWDQVVIAERNAAVSGIEERRGMLMQQVRKYQGREVIELKALFGGISWRKLMGFGFGFITDRLKALLISRRKWGVALKLITLSSLIGYCCGRSHHYSFISQRVRRTILSDSALDVFSARG